MRAMVFTGNSPRLEARDLPQPVPGPGEVLIRVEACGVCRTDLHIVDGELSAPRLPLVPGHEIVGRIERIGPGVTGLSRDELLFEHDRSPVEARLTYPAATEEGATLSVRARPGDEAAAVVHEDDDVQVRLGAGRRELVVQRGDRIVAAAAPPLGGGDPLIQGRCALLDRGCAGIDRGLCAASRPAAALAASAAIRRELRHKLLVR